MALFQPGTNKQNPYFFFCNAINLLSKARRWVKYPLFLILQTN